MFINDVSVYLFSGFIVYSCINNVIASECVILISRLKQPSVLYTITINLPDRYKPFIKAYFNTLIYFTLVSNALTTSLIV